MVFTFQTWLSRLSFLSTIQGKDIHQKVKDKGKKQKKTRTKIILLVSSFSLLQASEAQDSSSWKVLLCCGQLFSWLCGKW